MGLLHLPEVLFPVLPPPRGLVWPSGPGASYVLVAIAATPVTESCAACAGRIQAADRRIRSFIHSFTRCEAVPAVVVRTGKDSWQLLASPNSQPGEEDIPINNGSKDDNSSHA